ncbi:SH3 domain-containingprotein [Purpureocillium lavendulum]|uniref:SH3 domain-containingprotein n=1 Tax=Purpureocillium lavendulum TaxID=1247861 RepID=A0AB34G148_9HYPO|nr:SH3 domain-containingprotein [Purpureocillium lavendulum]
MPHHQHHHLHDRRGLGDDFDRWIDKMNPFKDNGGSNNAKSETDGGDTLVRTVYKTMEPTFKGPVAGYSTVGQAKDTPTQRPPPETTPTPKPQPKTTSTEQKKSPTTRESKESTSLPTVILQTDKPSSIDTVLAKATGDSSLSRSTTLGDSQVSSTLIVPSSSSTADSAAAEKSGDKGPSAGAKAGIAFGVLGGLLVVGLLVFFLISRRRKAAAERERLEDDEKFHGAVAPSPSPFEPTHANRTDPKAPRISLRPVTQFLPNWNGLDNKRSSKGAGMMLGAAAGGAAAGASARAVGGSAWERPGTSQSTNPANPFGSQAERVPSPITEERSHGHSGSPSVTDMGPTPESGSPPRPEDPLTANGPVVAAAAVAGTAVAAGAATGLARKTSMRHGGPKNVDLTLPLPHGGAMPPSPAGTEFSVSSVAPGTAPQATSGAAAIAAAGGPQNSAVHRVQLDFQPTLEDEMGLKAGELVRLLHEYDDGWDQDSKALLADLKALAARTDE